MFAALSGNRVARSAPTTDGTTPTQSLDRSAMAKAPTPAALIQRSVAKMRATGTSDEIGDDALALDEHRDARPSATKAFG